MVNGKMFCFMFPYFELQINFKLGVTQLIKEHGSQF